MKIITEDWAMDYHYLGRTCNTSIANWIIHCFYSSYSSLLCPPVQDETRFLWFIHLNSFSWLRTMHWKCLIPTVLKTQQHSSSTHPQPSGGRCIIALCSCLHGWVYIASSTIRDSWCCFWWWQLNARNKGKVCAPRSVHTEKGIKRKKGETAH